MSSKFYILIYYGFLTLYNIVFGMILPSFVFFFQEKGFFLHEIALAHSLSVIVFLCTDIVCGYIADNIPKKYILALGWGIQSTVYFLFVHIESLVWLYALYMCLGISRALYTGTLESWFVNMLHNIKYSGDQKYIFNNGQKITSAFLFIGIIGGAGIGHIFSYTAVYYIIAFTFMILMAMSLCIPRQNIKKTTLNNTYTQQKFFYYLLSLCKNQKYISLLLLSFGYGFVFGGFEIIWAPLFQEMAQPYSISPIVSAFFYGSAYLISAIVLIYAHSIYSLIGKDNLAQVILLRVLFGISFIFMYYIYPMYYTFMILVIIMYAISFLEVAPFKKAYHSLLKDRYRTSGLSMQSSVVQIGSVLGQIAVRRA